MGQQIQVKGFRDGLLVTLGTGALAEQVERLEETLAQRHSFLQGSRIALALGERPLTPPQLRDLQTLFTQHQLDLWAVLAADEQTKGAIRELGLATRLPGSQTDLDGNVLMPTANGKTAQTSRPVKNGTGTLFLKETLRSGRSIYHEGDVIIMGDVNPGAEIIATGDVLVWGRLRGLVHAGATGKETAVICALQLTPTQLRIADQIAISPTERPKNPAPEQAALRSGQIVAQHWQSRM